MTISLGVSIILMQIATPVFALARNEIEFGEWEKNGATNTSQSANIILHRIDKQAPLVYFL